MLRRITIENYALIDSLEIEFNGGLNTITGETGAGKSLLLGALSVILGGRADVSVLRDRERPCIVEAEFGIEGLGLEPFFEELDIDYCGNTVIRRVINPAGKARGYINDLPVNASVMKDLGERLIDIHSQHQTLLIRGEKFRTDLLDSVVNDRALMDSYAKAYSSLKQESKLLAGLRDADAEMRRDEEYLRHMNRELSDASLKEGEQEELEVKINELSHAEGIREALLSSFSVLDGDEAGVITTLGNIESALRKVEQFSARSAGINDRIRSVILELKDIAAEMQSEGERTDTDPEALTKAGDRLGLLYSLQQKYRVADIAGLIGLNCTSSERLSSIEGYDELISAKERLVEELSALAHTLATRISEARKSVIPLVEKYILETTASLAMPNVQFSVELTDSKELALSGRDIVRFMFSANRNVPVQPLENIASGGEMSRLMLALKSLTAQHKQLPAIIFDEIDSGISGETAHRMGGIIDTLSSRLQVINITHLPQIASKGESHYFVYKSDENGATNTHVKRLNREERITEIAKMLSGSNITPAAIEHAASLIDGK